MTTKSLSVRPYMVYTSLQCLFQVAILSPIAHHPCFCPASDHKGTLTADQEMVRRSSPCPRTNLQSRLCYHDRFYRERKKSPKVLSSHSSHAVEQAVAEGFSIISEKKKKEVSPSLSFYWDVEQRSFRLLWGKCCVTSAKTATKERTKNKGPIFIHHLPDLLNFSNFGVDGKYIGLTAFKFVLRRSRCFQRDFAFEKRNKKRNQRTCSRNSTK